VIIHSADGFLTGQQQQQQQGGQASGVVKGSVQRNKYQCYIIVYESNNSKLPVALILLGQNSMSTGNKVQTTLKNFVQKDCKFFCCIATILFISMHFLSPRKFRR